MTSINDSYTIRDFPDANNDRKNLTNVSGEDPASMDLFLKRDQGEQRKAAKGSKYLYFLKIMLAFLISNMIFAYLFFPGPGVSSPPLIHPHSTIHDPLQPGYLRLKIPLILYVPHSPHDVVLVNLYDKNFRLLVSKVHLHLDDKFADDHDSKEGGAQWKIVDVPKNKVTHIIRASKEFPLHVFPADDGDDEEKKEEKRHDKNHEITY